MGYTAEACPSVHRRPACFVDASSWNSAVSRPLVSIRSARSCDGTQPSLVGVLTWRTLRTQHGVCGVPGMGYARAECSHGVI